MASSATKLPGPSADEGATPESKRQARAPPPGPVPSVAMDAIRETSSRVAPRRSATRRLTLSSSPPSVRRFPRDALDASFGGFGTPAPPPDAATPPNVPAGTPLAATPQWVGTRRGTQQVTTPVGWPRASGPAG